VHIAANWIAHFGYLGVFSLLALGIVGLPFPDETLLTFVGYMVFKGRLHALPAALSVFSGAACGITLSYFLGRGFGGYVVPRWHSFLHIEPDRLQRVQQWFHRRGRWALVFGYYIPGVRHLTAYVAGTSGLTYGSFALFAYLGALCWSLPFMALGYFLGDRWDQLHLYLGPIVHILFGLAVVAILLYFFARKAPSARA
jgi:membrane protein DedA with SNARE-associated domain